MGNNEKQFALKFVFFLNEFIILIYENVLIIVVKLYRRPSG